MRGIKKYTNNRLGISFTYDASWKVVNYNVPNESTFDELARIYSSKFEIEISKLHETMCPFVKRWCMKKAIYCATNLGEEIVEDATINKYKVDNAECVSIVTSRLHENKETITEYILLLYKEKSYYLFIVKNLKTKIVPSNKNSGRQVRKFLDSLKFL